MTTQNELNRSAKQLAAALAEHDVRIVFAESCTGGLVSAVLTRVPGISQYLAGSAVVYQIETKHEWLGIPESVLRKPGPVSRAVAGLMADGVLKKTTHADLAVAVTGHLGPDAPKRQDGLVFLGALRRESTKTRRKPVIRRHVLPGDAALSGLQIRLRRQRTAAKLVLQLACEMLGQ